MDLPAIMRFAKNIIFCGFRVGAFLIGINIIYKCAIYSLKLKENIIKTKNIKENEIYKNYVMRYTSIARYNYIIEEDNMGYKMQLYANTSLSAAIYNIQLWLCSPKQRFLKRCKICFKHFATSDNKEKYCQHPCNFEMYKKIKLQRQRKNIKSFDKKNKNYLK